MGTELIYCIFNYDAVDTPWFTYENDVINYLNNNTEPGSHNAVLVISFKYDLVTEYVGDFALISVFEYITPGVV